MLVTLMAAGTELFVIGITGGGLFIVVVIVSRDISGMGTDKRSSGKGGIS